MESQEAAELTLRPGVIATLGGRIRTVICGRLPVKCCAINMVWEAAIVCPCSKLLQSSSTEAILAKAR